MGDVANKGEAEKCRDLAKQFFQKGAYEKAARFFRKSHSLHPLPGVLALAEKAEAYARGDIPQASASSSSSSRPNHGSASTPPPSSSSSSGGGASPRPSRTDSSGNTRQYTEEQEALAKGVLKKAKKGYYDVLGIEKGANEGQIKKAYRKLALKLHPDKNTAPSAEPAFKIIGTANDCLSNPEKRRVYDQTGVDGDDASTQQQGFRGGNPFGGMGGGFQGQQIDPEELINMFFGGGFGGGGARFRGGMGGRGGFGGMGGQQRGSRQQQQQQQQRGGGGGQKDMGGLFSVLQTVFVIILMMSYFRGEETVKPYWLDKDSKVSPLAENVSARGGHRGYGNFVQLARSHDSPTGLPFFVDPQKYFRTSPQEKKFVWKSVEDEWKQVYNTKCLKEQSDKTARVKRARWQGDAAFSKAQAIPTPSCAERTAIADRVVHLRRNPGIEFETKMKSSGDGKPAAAAGAGNANAGAHRSTPHNRNSNNNDNQAADSEFDTPKRK